MNHSLLASSILAILRITSGKSYTTGFQNIKKALVIKNLCCLEEFPKGYWMQRHNFSAIKQKYRERNCNMEALLHRILQVVLFLGERGLVFRGDSQRNGDPNNGHFLGILELIGQYDKILGDHLSKV